MRGGKVRKLAVLVTIGAVVALVLKKLRGDPAPQFSNHPTVKGGPLPDLLPAPQDPTTPAAGGTTLVPAPEDPTVPEPEPEPEPPAQPELDLEPLVPAPEDPTVPASAAVDLVPAPEDPTVPAEEQAWVKPVDGACPDGYPIKAKLKSGIYHQPGGLAYDRTNADRCYATIEAAAADGLRPPKR